MTIPPADPHRTLQPVTTTRSSPRSRRRRRAAFDHRLLAWPVGLALLLAALAVWRSDDGAPMRDVATAESASAVRSFGDLRLRVPSAWVTLQRRRDSVTWGTPTRSHAVTLAATEAAPIPLLIVARDVARQAGETMPGTRIVNGPTQLEDADLASRGDALVVTEFEVEAHAQARRLQVMQTWRRDAHSGHDIVATWTSSDGHWPIDPRSQLPTSSRGV